MLYINRHIPESSIFQEEQENSRNSRRRYLNYIDNSSKLDTRTVKTQSITHKKQNKSNPATVSSNQSLHKIKDVYVQDAEGMSLQHPSRLEEFIFPEDPNSILPQNNQTKSKPSKIKMLTAIETRNKPESVHSLSEDLKELLGHRSADVNIGDSEDNFPSKVL